MGSEREFDKYSTAGNAALPADAGEPLHEFRPSMANVISGIILAQLLFGFGIGAFLLIVREFGLANANANGLLWAGTAFLGAVGVGAAIGATLFLRFAVRLASQRIWLCSNALCIGSSGRFDVFFWDEIDVVREVVFEEHLPLHGIPLPAGRSRRFEITPKEGQLLVVNGNDVKRIERFGQVLKEIAETRRVAWQVVRSDT
jgi:hypothetical protein